MSSDGLLAAESVGISSTWLRTGKGAMLRVFDEFTFIRRASVKFANGVSSVVYEDEDHPPLAFRSDYLRRLGISEGSAVVVQAKGPSNLPKISDGSVVLVDTADRHILNGDFFAFRYEDDLLIKRLTRMDGVGVLAVAENSDFKPKQLVYRETDEGFSVIGKAKWIGAEL